MADDGSQQRKADFRTAVKDVKAVAAVLAMEAESILGRRTARVLGALALFAAVVGMLVWYIAPSGAAEKQALVVTLAQILAGTALLSGLYFTWRTLQVNREGQITERFTRAIEQLGATHADNSKNLELRLGGIYALERIARESEEDHWSIMEVLTAYVRQHAPRRPEEAQQVEEDATVEKKYVKKYVEVSALRFLRGKSEPSEVPDLAADIQAIMTVIGRRTRSLGHGEPEPLDLHETNLPGTNLEGADLTAANLSAANLTEAMFREADLSGADLKETDLAQDQLEEAIGDETTQLPPALSPLGTGTVKNNEQFGD